MTGKTGIETTSNEVASIAPKLLDDPHAPAKVKSIDAPVITQHPVFLSFLNKLTAELLTNINKKWEACWPINMLRPLVLLDLISYLLFIKKLEERQLISESQVKTYRGNAVTAKEKNELSWSAFKDRDAQSMHKLFTEEKGITGLIKNSHSKPAGQYDGYY